MIDELLFHALLAKNENGNKWRAGPQAGPNFDVNHGRSIIPQFVIEFSTDRQFPPILRFTQREGFTDESSLNPAAANGPAIQVAMYPPGALNHGRQDGPA